MFGENVPKSDLRSTHFLLLSILQINNLFHLPLQYVILIYDYSHYVNSYFEFLLCHNYDHVNYFTNQTEIYSKIYSFMKRKSIPLKTNLHFLPRNLLNIMRIFLSRHQKSAYNWKSNFKPLGVFSGYYIGNYKVHDQVCDTNLSPKNLNQFLKFLLISMNRKWRTKKNRLV